MSTIDTDGLTGATIDGDEVTEITVDGDVVWTLATEPDTREIDYFDSYSSTSDLFTNWTDDGSGSTTLESGGLVDGSTNQVRQDGTAELRSMVGDGLPNYIEEGRTFTAYLRPLVGGDSQYHLLANTEQDTWSTTTSSWRLEFHMTSGARVIYHDGSTRTIMGEYDWEYHWDVGSTYRLEIMFSYDEVRVDVYDGVNSTNRVTWARTTDVASSRIASEMNIGLRCSYGGGECLWDHVGYEPEN